MLAIGGILTAVNTRIKEYSVEYGASCDGISLCTVELDIKERMEPPIFFYYELDNFYQNHRRYVKSRSDTQLEGSYLNASSLTTCSPIVYNKDLGWGEIKAIDGTTVLDPNGPAHPCGLIAWSFFNGNYVHFLIV